jgi:hypothetical protein
MVMPNWVRYMVSLTWATAADGSVVVASPEIAQAARAVISMPTDIVP